MDRWDVLALLGIVFVGCGLWLVAPWLGLTVAGAVLLGVGLGGAVFSEKAAATRALLEAKGGAR